MRLTCRLFRGPIRSEAKVPVKPAASVALKNYVLSSGSQSSGKGCLSEMTLLLSCLQSDSSGRTCKAELERLNNCFISSVKASVLEKKRRQQEIPAPNSKSLTDKQVNYMLRKYPTV